MYWPNVLTYLLLLLYFYNVRLGFITIHTGGMTWVLTPHGATVLVRIPYFAHSQAKFFVTWLIAPAENRGPKPLI